MTNRKRRLFLASTSPRRKEILKTFGIPFKTIPNALVHEPKINPFLPLTGQVRQLAIQKAVVSQAGYQGLILSADTLVCLNGTVFGKPKSLAEAKRMLAMLSGKTHTVYSSVCLIDTITAKKKSRVITSYVTFQDLTPSQINVYCDYYRPLDKAGGYGIQELPDGYVAYVDGCIYNVMGLPIKTVLQLLKDYDIV